MASLVKVLSVGLGDLVSGRNAALRAAGFDVVAAISFDEVVEACRSVRFDVSVVGHAFPLMEKVSLVRCLQGVFRLPVIMITDGRFPASMRAESQVLVDAPLSELVSAVTLLARHQKPAAPAVGARTA